MPWNSIISIVIFTWFYSIPAKRKNNYSIFWDAENNSYNSYVLHIINSSRLARDTQYYQFHIFIWMGHVRITDQIIRYANVIACSSYWNVEKFQSSSYKSLENLASHAHSIASLGRHKSAIFFSYCKKRRQGIKAELCNLGRNICTDLCPLRMEAFQAETNSSFLLGSPSRYFKPCKRSMYIKDQMSCHLGAINFKCLLENSHATVTNPLPRLDKPRDCQTFETMELKTIEKNIRLQDLRQTKDDTGNLFCSEYLFILLSLSRCLCIFFYSVEVRSSRVCIILTMLYLICIHFVH